MQRHEYPDMCEMRFNGGMYEVNLCAFRRALVYRQIEGRYPKDQSELAGAAGTSRSTVNRLFGGRSVSLPTLAAIAQALRLDVNDVMRPAKS